MPLAFFFKPSASSGADQRIDCLITRVGKGGKTENNWPAGCGIPSAEARMSDRSGRRSAGNLS